MIIKSQNDKREYKAIKLSNDLQCVIISDPDTQKSAASMVVNVGSFEDPIERQGLAHFCEHMLFLGSQKYPNEAEYRDYINSNSGSCNAYTSNLITNYMFQISNKAFQGALDRFAQFFIAPLFTQSGTDREMKAVDSEFNMNFKVDAWRKSMVMKHLAQADNKFSQFTIGNMKTLLFDDTREFLLQFHKKWYSSNLMKLVILGSQSIEELEKWVVDTFSTIKNKNLDPPKYIDQPYKEYGKLVKFVPIKDNDYLEIRWMVEYLHPYYKNCPGNYVSHLLGHEGENSLLSLLKAEGLVTELMAGSSSEMRLFSYLNCRVKLTKQGLNEVERVIGFIYQYLNILKDRGVQEWIFDETKLVRKLQFDYLEKSSPFDYVSNTAASLPNYPVEDILKVGYFQEEYQPELLTRFINSIQSEKVFITLSSQDFKGQLDSVEEYFGSEYSVQNIPENYYQAMKEPTNTKLELCNKPLDLPPRNIFLPKNTDILPIKDNEHILEPKIIHESEKSVLWYKRDNTFQVPKAFVFVRIYTTEMNYGRSDQTEVLARIWRKLIDVHLRELMYLADQAILYPSIELSPNGVNLSFEGFNDALAILVEKYLQKILEFNVQDYETYFSNCYESVRQSLENALKEKPFVQIQNTKISVIRDGSDFTFRSLLKALKNVTFQDVVNFQRNWLKKVRFETLVQGNIHIETAKSLQTSIEEAFKCETLSKDQVLQMRPVKIPQDLINNYSFDLQEPGETNSSVLVHYQIGNLDIRGQVLVDVMLNVIKTDFFEQLRTQEQLGYAVFSMQQDNRGVQAFEFLIQSNSKSCHFVQNRIRDFLQNKMNETISTYTQEKFETSKQSIRITLLEKYYQLSQEVLSNWLQIQRHQFQFDLKQQKLIHLDDLKLDELQELFIETFLKNPRCLEIHANSEVHKQEDELLKKERQDNVLYSQEISKLKRRLELFVDYHGIQ